ncbi:unknown [[Mannheimia] succiniciproducens MBEL55E]|uniref:Uncharacterized protein n=1 Tax=Mannheimia succiniciproducens (strain KCTC 0769BP / MBEL55E) TaxID=221988 RepID=Q65S69_MANSM|nr:unknown [[Mannheimia] succiniciproducens MBEL55E]
MGPRSETRQINNYKIFYFLTALLSKVRFNFPLF